MEKVHENVLVFVLSCKFKHESTKRMHANLPLSAYFHPYYITMCKGSIAVYMKSK